MVSNLSYWERKNFFNADVIIIGSGIVGLNAAITIKELAPKTNIIILERGFLPTGASTKNAGFACFGSISELIEQENSIGTDSLHQLIGKRWNGLLKLRSLLGDRQIDFFNHGGFELFRPTDSALSEQCVSKMSHFNTLIEDIVLQKNVFVNANQKIGLFGLKGVDVLIENQLEAQIDPGLMMKALLTKTQSLGVQIYNSCKVTALNHEGEQVMIAAGDALFCGKKVLLTTNAFVKDLLPELDVVPGRGQVIVTKPIDNLKLRGTYHYDKGYYYFRNVDGRVLIGGGRNLDFAKEQTTDFGSTEIVQQSLEKLLKELILPNISFEIEHRWSGIMAFGSQLHPIIDEIKPAIFAAVRCNGMGIAIGSNTGEEAGKMIVKNL